MKKMIDNGKLRLSTQSVRELSTSLTPDELKKVAGATTSCLILTRNTSVCP